MKYKFDSSEDMIELARIILTRKVWVYDLRDVVTQKVFWDMTFNAYHEGYKGVELNSGNFFYF